MNDKALWNNAKKVLALPTPDKFRLCAEVLEKTNDVKMALLIAKRACDELELWCLLGDKGKQP